MDEKDKKIKKLKKTRNVLIILFILAMISTLYFAIETIAWRDASASYCEVSNEAVETLNAIIEKNYAEYPDIQSLTKLDCPERVFDS